MGKLILAVLFVVKIPNQLVQLVIVLLFCLIGKQGLDRADGEKVRNYFFSFESEDKTGIQLCWLQGYY